MVRMDIIFCVPTRSEVEAVCIKVKKKVHLRDGTLGDYDDAKCKHCTLSRCTGHVGYIDLNFKIFHPLYFSIVPKLMSCFCSNCKTLIQLKCPAKDFDEYIKFAHNSSIGYCTPGCETVADNFEYTHTFNSNKQQFEYKNVDKPLGLKMKDGDVVYDTNTIQIMFGTINDEDIVKLGFYQEFNPRALIVDYILVLPNNVRNNLKIDGNADSYTMIYEKLLNSKVSAIEAMNSTISIIGCTAANNNIPMIRHMITSKTGLGRSNLMSSRQFRSARSVISVNSYIPLSHVGVPDNFKNKLTVYVYLKSMKISDIVNFMLSDECVAYGNLPKRNYKDMPLYKFEKSIRKLKLDNYYVERALRDDDWVYINRQPTLHRHSIIAFKVKLIPQRTIALNSACVTAFNADFDGDEITLYVASDRNSIEECKTKLAVEHNIMSPENGKLVIFPVQDCITGTYIMSMSHEPMPKGLIDLMEEIIGTRVNTPIEAINAICHVEYETPINSKSLDKIIRNLKPKDAIEFMSKLQLVVDAYLKAYPLSVSYTDFNPLDDETIDGILKKHYYDNNYVMEKAHEYKEMYPFYADRIEPKICDYLDTTVKESILEETMSIVPKSDLIHIIESGAKGKTLSLVQSWVALCQQYVFGRQETMYGMSDMYTSAEKHGFVTTSYGRGLDEAGMFYQATAARSTIINTGVNTADPGYLQRQLSKFMADVYVDEDMEVINHDGVVIAKFDSFNGLDRLNL